MLKCRSWEKLSIYFYLFFVFLQTDLAVVGKNTAANSQLTEENGAFPNELANKVPFFFLPFDIFKILILNQTCYWFLPFSSRITFRLNKHQIQSLFFRILLWSLDVLSSFVQDSRKVISVNWSWKILILWSFH
jgi:hypothetical protein